MDEIYGDFGLMSPTIQKSLLLTKKCYLYRSTRQKRGTPPWETPTAILLQYTVDSNAPRSQHAFFFFLPVEKRLEKNNGCDSRRLIGVSMCSSSNQ